ncbi:hypothetical protein Pst134EB_010507 [Puccinia striiformis f. sp. tritici]|nr:hypothetical protein Pst134EB_010507 [Puccinia striiformis f. sp. tritici]
MANPQNHHQHRPTTTTHEPANDFLLLQMTPSAAFIENPYHHYHDHNHLILDSESSADHHHHHHHQSCLGAPTAEPSSDTFFASHKAQRSFRGVVEKFHQNPSNAHFDQVQQQQQQQQQHFDSNQWAQWPPQPNDFNAFQENNNQPVSAFQGQATQQQQQPTTTAPYRTRSLVHRLVNQSDPAGEGQHADDPSTLQPYFYDCLSSSQFGTTRQSNSLSTTGPAHQPRSVLNKQELPPDSQRIRSTFDSNRSRDGLPSNSHHLLNSPELKTAQINRNLGDKSIQDPNEQQLYQKNQADPGPDSESESSQPNTNQLAQPNPQSIKSTKGITTTCKKTTPQKGKSVSTSHLEQNPTDPSNHHPPSDDAASILLTLSRHEPPKHGMSLRRGRGGPAHQQQNQQQPSSDPRTQLPPTPCEPRYRTRSQINDEQPSDDRRSHNPSSQCVQISSQQPGQHSSSGIENNQSHIIPSGLGYGFPTSHHQALISVSGSTSTSTCTSRSNTGDGSVLNVTPCHDSTFSLYSLVGKPHTNLSGRLHFKSSGVSTPLSMTHSSTTNSIIHGNATMIDDDAKSSFSISTQATSMISPPGYFTRRTFPPEVPIEPNFPRLYRTFFVSSAFGEREPIRSQAELYKITIMKQPANSNFNTPAHGYMDLYTPRYVKGVGAEKLGLCCICAEPKDRGGTDTQLWLKMKVSSYSYHLSFFHGINNADGLPFSPPVETRRIKRCHVAANEKLELKEGRCHQCNKWVPMEGVKMQDVKVPELFWWKHAKSCHKSRLAGECHVHTQDEIYDLVTRQQPSSTNGSVGGYIPISSCSTPYSYYRSHDLPSSNSAYGGSRYDPGSPAPTCASSVSQSGGGSRVHPSVAAQRASAGRVYKRKASNSSLGGGKRRSDSFLNTSTSTTSNDLNHSPHTNHNWQPISSISDTVGSSSGTNHSTITPLLLHHHHHQDFLQHPLSPTPTPAHPIHPIPNGRKTRRSNMLN